MTKLDFDEALERINEQRPVARSDISAAALARKVWFYEWHLPGCLSESSGLALTKADAIDSLCMMAETENGTPHGMKTALRKTGRFDSQSGLYGTCINTITRGTLADFV